MYSGVGVEDVRRALRRCVAPPMRTEMELRVLVVVSSMTTEEPPA
jgi:hypothetical protein